MKRKIMGLTVVVLALSLSAFVKHPDHKKFGQYYWFPLDSGGFPIGVNRLVYQSYDPFVCAPWSWGGYCSGAWTSYTGSSAPYFPAGMEVQIDYYLLP